MYNDIITESCADLNCLLILIPILIIHFLFLFFSFFWLGFHCFLLSCFSVCPCGGGALLILITFSWSHSGQFPDPNHWAVSWFMAPFLVTSWSFYWAIVGPDYLFLIRIWAVSWFVAPFLIFAPPPSLFFDRIDPGHLSWFWTPFLILLLDHNWSWSFSWSPTDVGCSFLVTSRSWSLPWFPTPFLITSWSATVDPDPTAAPTAILISLLISNAVPDHFPILIHQSWSQPPRRTPQARDNRSCTNLNVKI